MTETMELKPMPDETILSNELKPCPFCGEQPVFVNIPNSYEIYCEECGKANADGTTQVGVYSEWNTRAQPSAPADVVEKMAQALRDIMDLQGEINPSNYDHDDVCKLNSSFVESWIIANAAIAAYEASLQPTEKG